MARLTKEERKVFDPTLLIRSQKREAKIIKDLLIGERINVPGESAAYDTEKWKKEVDYTSPKKIPGEIEEIQGIIPGLEDLAHHTGGGKGLDGFQDKPIDAILQDIITNETISDEERARTLERILGPDYKNIINQFQQQQQKNSLKIGNQQLAMADKMYRVTDWDKKQNNEAWKQFMKGNPNYFYKPIKA